MVSICPYAHKSYSHMLPLPISTSENSNNMTQSKQKTEDQTEEIRGEQGDYIVFCETRDHDG